MKFLAALIPSLINALSYLFVRFITAIGLTAVSFVGLDMLIREFKSEIKQLLLAVPNGALQLFYLAGGGVVLNILFGCLTFFVTFKSMSKLVPKGAKGGK